MNPTQYRTSPAAGENDGETTVACAATLDVNVDAE
jgi:hypothetical protein